MITVIKNSKSILIISAVFCFKNQVEVYDANLVKERLALKTGYTGNENSKLNLALLFKKIRYKEIIL